MTADTEIALSVYVAIEQRITASVEAGHIARWECGQLLLQERAGRKRLPNKRLEDIIEATGRSKSELSFRMAFAERFATRDQLSSALDSLPSWHEITHPTKEPELVAFTAPDGTIYHHPPIPPEPPPQRTNTWVQEGVWACPHCKKTTEIAVQVVYFPAAHDVDMYWGPAEKFRGKDWFLGADDDDR